MSRVKAWAAVCIVPSHGDSPRPPTPSHVTSGLKQHMEHSRVAPAPPEDAKRLFRVTPLRERSSLLQLLTTPVDTVVLMPKRYFKASNELVFLTLIVCWIVTLVHDADDAWNHPARRYVGHMNPCFGWDYAPASYFGCFACVSRLSPGLNLRFASMRSKRIATALGLHDALPTCALAGGRCVPGMDVRSL